MANTLKLTAGAQSTPTTLSFTAADFNSLAVGSCAVMPVANYLDNATNSDLMIDVDFKVTVGGTTPSGGYFTLFMLPLVSSTTFGDGTATGSALPGLNYAVGNIFPIVGITSGNTVTGVWYNIQLPRRRVIFGIGNACIALSASAAVAVNYQTTNFTNNG